MLQVSCIILIFTISYATEKKNQTNQFYLQFGIDFGIFFFFFIKVIYEWNGHSFVEIKYFFFIFYSFMFFIMYYSNLNYDKSSKYLLRIEDVKQIVWIGIKNFNQN